MTDLSRRDVLKVSGFGIGLGLGAFYSSGDQPAPAGGGGGNQRNVQTPVPGGEHLGGSSGDGYRVDVGTTIGSIPEPGVFPHLVYVTGSTHEKGTYVRLGADQDVPLVVRTEGFEIAIADSLGSVPDRRAPLQYVLVRSGADKGEYVNTDANGENVADGVLEIAVASALAGIPQADQFPGLAPVTGSGAEKGTYTDTEA